MAPVKSRISTEATDDGKSRLERVLALLSQVEGRPWFYVDLAAWLRQEGFEIDDDTPKKWPQRGIPERWARILAERAPHRGVVGLTATWLREGKGRAPAATATVVTASGAELAETDVPLSQALEMIGKAVGAAVRRIVEKDLVENTRKARQSLADNLHEFALELQRGGVDATELFDIVQRIRDGRLLS